MSEGEFIFSHFKTRKQKESTRKIYVHNILKQTIPIRRIKVFVTYNKQTRDGKQDMMGCVPKGDKMERKFFP